MNVKRALTFLIALLAFVSKPSAADAPGLLQMFDGTSLHGTLEGISTNQGVSWEFPAAQGPLV